MRRPLKGDKFMKHPHVICHRPVTLSMPRFLVLIATSRENVKKLVRRGVATARVRHA